MAEVRGRPTTRVLFFCVLLACAEMERSGLSLWFRQISRRARMQKRAAERRSVILWSLGFWVGFGVQVGFRAAERGPVIISRAGGLGFIVFGFVVKNGSFGC